MVDTSTRLNIVGGNAITRDVLAHVMADAGFEISAEGSVPNNDVVLLLADNDDPQRALANVNWQRVVVVADVDPTRESAADLVINGADAIVNLQSTAQDLAQVVRVVAGGGSVIAPKPARRVSELARATALAHSDLPRLTPREVDILTCIGQGQSVKETAATLGITPKTVENLQSRLFKKLDVRNRAQAFAQAHALGLIPAATALATR
jgi:DNA-binding NarL/FixJ family response regulator